MRSRFFTSVTAPLVVSAVVSLAPPSFAGQGSTTAPKNSTTAAKKTPAKTGSSPRTAWGALDLQGVWDYRSMPLLERPIAVGGKEVLTDEEVAEVERQKADFEAADPKDRNNVAARSFSTSRAIGDPVDEQAYNSYWF